jgi:hypothetical protein
VTVTCPGCKAELSVAGAYNRRPGERPSKDEGRVPAGGRADWGRHACPGCGMMVVIPEAREQGVVG